MDYGRELNLTEEQKQMLMNYPTTRQKRYGVRVRQYAIKGKPVNAYSIEYYINTNGYSGYQNYFDVSRQELTAILDGKKTQKLR